MKKIKVFCIFKSALIWQRTGQRPTLENDPRSEIPGNNFVFVFEDSKKVRDAIDEFVTDNTGIKSFTECYKNLRQELYMKKGPKSDQDIKTEF